MKVKRQELTKVLYAIIMIILTISIVACNKDDDIEEDDSSSTSLNNIMPLGASRVQGSSPDHESYRYDLWKDLIDGGWDFDYIGTSNDAASYPAYNGNDFDVDHEGHGGWTSVGILSSISGWLAEAGTPDIVLFSSPGANDALQGLLYDDAITNINAIIDEIQSANPDVTIIIEQMAPAHSSIMTTELTTYFDQMQEEVVTIASEQTTSTSQVITVDMFTDFSDDYFADDGVHYNEDGADFIATQYYSVLVDLLQ
ncbi:MAG: hypothetical protein HN704_09975 [Bacteroidetes bacterium]|jgi:lysophospholipase L1-like esterase|nr:hypothetical protein [Bacteroidota bacterium]MBT6687123.1 hypothetical protein [Bacteroidota bacterium]MBT7145146.1 hypothetical protein [Bacteroidota bacterium]MBT7491921.1 hypothetical protein [Bacteroidota bacterium]